MTTAVVIQLGMILKGKLFVCYFRVLPREYFLLIVNILIINVLF